jgi:hypothetical protein
MEPDRVSANGVDLVLATYSWAGLERRSTLARIVSRDMDKTGSFDALPDRLSKFRVIPNGHLVRCLDIANQTKRPSRTITAAREQLGHYVCGRRK